MKFIPALLLAALKSADAIHQQADVFYNKKTLLGQSMWHFNADGLTIYSPKGDVLKQHRKKNLCKPYFSYHRNTMIYDCSYFDAASDGHRYVWAAGHHGTYHHVAAFDINTGDHAGDEATCNTPLDLDYLPSRREMWVRCAAGGEGDNTGEMDVFSSNSIGASHTPIALNATSRPYGRFETHSDMGPVGYVSSYNYPFLSELDLVLKEVSNEYKLEKASGAYAMAYSPVNGHLYVRTRVCCTCGSPEAETESCGYGDPKKVLVQTGPNANEEPQIGTCGTGCLGSTADTLGVMEFDTVEKEFIANHNIKKGTGFGADPVASPDGKYIVFLPNDGGKNVRIISPNANGKPSSVLKDIPVNFEGGEAGKMAISDFAFVSDAKRDILVLASPTDNNVVLVDLKKNFRTRKVNLSSSAEKSTATSSRQVEWAVGTNYVWVNGDATREQYILDVGTNIDTVKVTRTLTDVANGKMIYVNNYERLGLIEEMAGDFVPDYTLGTVGLVFGCVALLVGLVATAIIVRNGNRSVVSASNVASTSPLAKEGFAEDVEGETQGSNLN